MWGGEEREVAVKSLTYGSTEEKRIQFLQEAATMCQFKHPNVMTLHGVLRDNDQVTLISNPSVSKGDNDCGGVDENGRSWCSPILNQV